MKETDEVIYYRFLKSGDEDDLRTLLEKYNESLTFFVYGLIHNMEDAEEIMLDAFAVAASGTSKFHGRSSFKTWLFSIARNLALKHIRKNRVQIMPLEEEIAADESAELTYLSEGLSGSLEKERRDTLYRALRQLPEEYRQVLYLIYFEDMSTDEAAVVMKKNKKQIYNLAARGKMSLKKNLERMGFDYEEF